MSQSRPETGGTPETSLVDGFQLLEESKASWEFDSYISEGASCEPAVLPCLYGLPQSHCEQSLQREIEKRKKRRPLM